MRVGGGDKCLKQTFGDNGEIITAGDITIIINHRLSIVNHIWNDEMQSFYSSV
jgi:hypothetical protein